MLSLPPVVCKCNVVPKGSCVGSTFPSGIRAVRNISCHFAYRNSFFARVNSKCSSVSSNLLFFFTSENKSSFCIGYIIYRQRVHNVILIIITSFVKVRENKTISFYTQSPLFI